jgi:hypothetical protein
MVTTSGLPWAADPEEVNGISQFPPLCVDAVTLKLSVLPPVAVRVSGSVEGLACNAPVVAEKFKIVGFAVNSEVPPTVIVTSTTVGLDVLPCWPMLNDVS